MINIQENPLYFPRAGIISTRKAYLSESLMTWKSWLAKATIRRTPGAMIFPPRGRIAFFSSRNIFWRRSILYHFSFSQEESKWKTRPLLQTRKWQKRRLIEIIDKADFLQKWLKILNIKNPKSNFSLVQQMQHKYPQFKQPGRRGHHRPFHKRDRDRFRQDLQPR